MFEDKENSRVLSRRGARVLNAKEYEEVGGGFSIGHCTFNPVTCAMDGVCSPLPRCPLPPQN